MSKPMVVHINAKCSDMCGVQVWNEDGKKIYDGDGYVPRLPGVGSGDYITLKIENKTGLIIGWQPLDVDDVEGFDQ